MTNKLFSSLASGEVQYHRGHVPAHPLSVCVVGLGYIGLPTSAVLARKGHRVVGVDVRNDVVETINQGRIHIHEPGLGGLVESAVKGGGLVASLEPCLADVFILCVPTPVTKDLAPDISLVKKAARSIRPHVRKGCLIVLESTSPPGTTEGLVVKEAVPEGMTVGKDVFVAYCPERVLPGRILIEVIQNDRVVGGVTPNCTRRAKQFYESFVEGTVSSASAVEAEFAKLAENAFRDVNIAFANELAVVAEQFAADARVIIGLANRHPRVDILSPGPGVGGHCISVDPWFLVHSAPKATPLIRTAREVNDRQPLRIVEKVESLVRDSGASVVGCLGLAYKADVDDLRESPSLEIVRRLRQRRIAEILACDPYVSAERFQEFPLATLDEVIRRSDVLVLLTDHARFADIPTELLDKKLVLDTRGLWRRTTKDTIRLLTVKPESPARRRAA